MTEIVVAIPPTLQPWVDTRLAERGYVDAAEYIRDLVRRDQDGWDEQERDWLRSAIAEADASALIDAEPEDVIEAIIREFPATDA